MSDLVRLVPPTPPPDHKAEVSATTVHVLERLLELARAGEVTNIVAITWHAPGAPQIHISTEDKILALGAVRSMEHLLVRSWLDD